MKNTEELYDALKNGLLSIRQVINMAKARPAHLMAPKHVGAPLTTTSTSAARAGKASVEYVRLRREEQANMIVLSGAEKSCSTIKRRRAVGTTGLVLHSYCLNRLKQFYVLKAKTRCYIEDIK
ncbi:hypothetical protein PC129_g12669 [Phytophthora cactorum]|uniref:Uncharacterized protein n=1 Tax=Phytophthora cactorum TaxID=29920 RepID=A0A8T1HWY7_9STRA|nr:hypothetical protein PC114_g16286 [Phytophthora cactorum]KAG2917922.1 hypothetical protein PC115_g10604 [Phytophthora cactorum]KAG3216479.1 hypothetical protein PC129_g12669 [Phytophthora cactorum]KAG4241387.1 hypothetical protein PC116_g10683 [Phytophthora cactorum]